MTRQVIHHGEDVADWFDGKGESFAFDTETTDLRYDRLSVLGLSFSNGRDSCYIIANESTLPALRYTIRDIVKTLIAHNLVFDLKVLKKYDIPYDHCKLYCTMVADHLIDENRPHGLKHLAKELLGHEVASYEETAKLGTDSQEFYDYAINDALWTWELCMWQQAPLREQGLAKLFREIEMPFQHILVEMETNGWLVDREKIAATTEKLKEEITDMQIRLLDMVNREYEIQHDLFGNLNVVSKTNLNSTQQLVQIFEELGLEIKERTPSGAMSVGRKTIEDLKEAHPFVGLLYKYKIASKLLSAFFEPMPDRIDSDGRIRPNFKDTGTKTGRLSCQNPNLQQLPKVNKEFPIDTRECFICSPGYKMIACDYSGQELRVLAEISQEKSMIDSFKHGRDFHLATANDFFNLNIKDGDLYEHGSNYTENKAKYKAERNKAKIINFGMAYGKGAFGFSQDFGISEQEAEQLLTKYFAALPEVKRAIDLAHSDVRERGYTCNLAGRRRRFTPNEQGYYPGSAFRQSFNFQIQGFSADMIRMAMIKVREDVQKKHPEWDLRCIATVHDESVYEVKEEYAQQAAQAIKEAFETAVTFSLPVVADVDIGNNYSEAK